METIVERLNRVLGGMFKVSFDFVEIDELRESMDWRVDEITVFSESNRTYPAYLVNRNTKQFGFPVCRRGRVEGLAVVTGIQEDSENVLDTVTKVSDLLGFVLGDLGDLQTRARDLRSIESVLENQISSPNVISITEAPRKSEVVQLDSWMDSMFDLDSSEKIDPICAESVLIHCDGEFPVQRLALEIHHLSNRIAFVSSRDLSEDVFSKRENLSELGMMTVFIPKIEELTIAQQEVIAQFLVSPVPAESTQIIASTSVDPERLCDEGRLSRNLLAKIQVKRLEIRSNGEGASMLVAAALRLLNETSDSKPLAATIDFAKFRSKRDSNYVH